jgi:hypothetical protein
MSPRPLGTTLAILFALAPLHGSAGPPVAAPAVKTPQAAPTQVKPVPATGKPPEVKCTCRVLGGSGFQGDARGFTAPAAATSGTVQVDPGNGCTWSVATDSPAWLTTSGGGSGQGLAHVAAAGNDGLLRRSRLTFTCRSGSATSVTTTVSLDQRAASCRFSFLGDSPRKFPREGGNAVIRVQGNASCRGLSWTPSSNAPDWLRIAAGAKSLAGAEGTVSYTVGPNQTRAPRRGIVTISYPDPSEHNPVPGSAHRTLMKEFVVEQTL